LQGIYGVSLLQKKGAEKENCVNPAKHIFSGRGRCDLVTNGLEMFLTALFPKLVGRLCLVPARYVQKVASWAGGNFQFYVKTGVFHRFVAPQGVGTISG